MKMKTINYSHYLNKKVYHPEYGYGTVAKIENSDYQGNLPIYILFDNGGGGWLNYREISKLVITKVEQYSLTF